MILDVSEGDRARLLKFIAISDEDSCWNWTGCVVDNSPKWLPYKSGLSHSPAKAMYQLFKGDIPEGRKVTRTCNNSLCCNPNHLVTDVERFLSKIDKTPGLGIGNCWEWLDHIKAGGYGEFRPNSKSRVQAHRFMYELVKGSIPKGVHVCHTCDHRKCVNPDHLFLGTPKDNQRDMTIKGRGRVGTRNGSAKLTEQDVMKIKDLLAQGFTQTEIAKRFNVAQTTISPIALGRRWKHVN